MKLTFINFLKHQNNDVLSKQVLNEQIRLNLPGLARECEEMCYELGIDNIIKNEVPMVKWKSVVKRACKQFMEEEVQRDIQRFSKLEDMRGEVWGIKQYMQNKCIDDARYMFRIRTKMVDLKMNFQNDPRFKRESWMCKCLTTVESQKHVLLYCKEYSELREGVDFDNDKDLVEYFRDVLALRDKVEPEV